MAGTVLLALSVFTLLAGQNGQGASARSQNSSPGTPQLQIGARTYAGDHPVATALSGVGDDVNGTVSVDASGCSVSSMNGTGAGVRQGLGPSAVRWGFTAHIIDRTAGGVVADIEWERDSASYGELPKNTRRVNLRLGESVVIDELAPKAPDNLCGATAMRLEASLVVPAWNVRAGVGAGSEIGRGAMASGGVGAGASTGPTWTRGSGGGRSAGGTGAAAGGTAIKPSEGEDLRVRAIAMRDFTELMATVQGQGVGAGAGSAAGGKDLLSSVRPFEGASYDAEVWLVHTPTGGPEETQRVDVHVDGNGQAFEFPAVTITTPQGPAKVDVVAMLRPVASANGDIMLCVAIVRRIDGPNNSVTGGSTKIIPLPAPADIISFELPDTHGTTFDVLNGHQFSVRVKIARK